MEECGLEGSTGLRRDVAPLPRSPSPGQAQPRAARSRPPPPHARRLSSPARLDMAETLARAGDEALRSGAVEHDTDAIAETLESATAAAVKAHHVREARALPCRRACSGSWWAAAQRSPGGLSRCDREQGQPSCKR